MKLDYDEAGVVGFFATDPGEAFFALGYVHALHRPLQTLIVHTAARGQLAAKLAPKQQLVDIDALVHRLDLVRLGEREALRLDAETAARLDGYCAGVAQGLADHGQPFELRALHARLAPPTRASLCGALGLSAYLGLAQGQERMERAIVEALAEGANEALLEDMFAPHLQGWSPELLRAIPRGSRPGFASAGMIGGGSNAWAITGARSASGNAILCGDPHLQIDALPSLFLEIRARVGDGYWLGASIPGLPGLALGRTREVAWAGTFAVADNVDFSIEPEAGDTREVTLARRFRSPLKMRFTDGPRGTFENERLCVRWAGRDKLAECLAAYVRLPFAKSAAEADALLQQAHTLSLHYVVSDRSGEVRYRQVGRIPEREVSGLYPRANAEWGAMCTMPAQLAQDGIVASANEARLSPDGRVLATLAQPEYRLQRIRDRLLARNDHDIASMQALQCDLYSLQQARLLPLFTPHLPSEWRERLQGWRGGYDEPQAMAFEHVYAAARRALAPELGGAWFERALTQSELPIWWCAAIDRVLARAMPAKRAARFVAALARAPEPAPNVHFKHMLLGAIPGAARGPFPQPGCRATVWQGYRVVVDGNAATIGPAYRFVTDMGEDAAYTALPGGREGSVFSPDYASGIADYLAGRYKRITPPA